MNKKTLIAIILSFIEMMLNDNKILFIIYLLLNCIDTLTGWIKARLTKKENSKAGFKGIVNKVMCWMLITVSFLISATFIHLGKILNINFENVIFIGWFVLGSLIVNECRSILENLVESGCNVPNFLIKGLETANELMDKDDQSSGRT